jgi:2-phosphoglycerate kinase
MIYLIGGPPRCGKTTLAKAMSKKRGISWISTDMLEVVTGEYMTQKEWDVTHPYTALRRKHKTNDAFYGTLSPQKIVSVLRQNAKPTYSAIEAVVSCAVADGYDLIIEGYHLEPVLVNKLIKKYGEKHVQAIFLVKHDSVAFARDVYKSTTKNDWLLVLTKKKETFLKVGEMVSFFSGVFEKEVKKYGLKVVAMDTDFNQKIKGLL